MLKLLVGNEAGLVSRAMRSIRGGKLTIDVDRKETSVCWKSSIWRIRSLLMTPGEALNADGCRSSIYGPDPTVVDKHNISQITGIAEIPMDTSSNSTT